MKGSCDRLLEGAVLLFMVHACLYAKASRLGDDDLSLAICSAPRRTSVQAFVSTLQMLMQITTYFARCR